MSKNRILQTALAFGFALAVAVPSIGSAAGDKSSSSSDVSKFKSQIQKDTKISQQDLTAIEPQLREFSQNNADPNKVSQLAQTAVQNNCTGPCLRDVLSSMNNAMSKGMSDNDAQDMVASALRDQVQARGGTISDPSELGNQVRSSVDAQLASRSGSTGGTMGGTSGGATGGTTGGGMSGTDTGTSGGATSGGAASGGSSSSGSRGY